MKGFRTKLSILFAYVGFSAFILYIFKIFTYKILGFTVELSDIAFRCLRLKCGLFSVPTSKPSKGFKILA